jgi:undecaprenyl phosphate N,N'-diacetylbacillosamine 1-phosphate transferase
LIFSYRTFWKRVFDVLFSFLLMISLSWLFLLIIILYLINGYRAIFFTQERTGWKEKPFRLYKFRTLKEGDTLSPAERTFGLGNFLRTTSLDELPQLWHVLKGDMSMMGPRPLPVDYLPRFTLQQRTRHIIRPGITGWAQVNGRHTISWEEKFILDIYYVENVSLWLDLVIIFKTIGLLLSLKKDTSLQEKEFRRND